MMNPNANKKIVITGTAGLLGPYVVDHFLAEGYEVLSVDLNQPKELKCPHWTVDLTDIGQVFGMLNGAYGVVHLAAVPRNGLTTPQKTYENNIMSSYNIYEACSQLGINKVVIASSECAYGFCFAKEDLVPAYLPLDEDHPLWSEDSYGMAKIAAEETAKGFVLRNPDMQIINMRLGNIMTPETYGRFAEFIGTTDIRTRNIWNYIDARDIATACSQAIKLEGLGAQIVNIGAEDTCQPQTNAELIKAEFPTLTDIRIDTSGHAALYCIKKAKALLDWRPVHFWRDNFKG